MRKLQLFIVFLVLMLMTSGCAQFNLNRTEIDRIFNTRVIGIDKTPDGKIKYTISSKSAGESPQGTSAPRVNSEILVSEGETVFEAARLLLAISNKKPHYGHTEFILFGEDTAKDGILPYLDFISRNHEFRYNAKIYIVQGETANSFINKLNAGDMYLADMLSIMEDNENALSQSSRVKVSEAMFIFDKKQVSTFLPFVRLEQPPSSAEKSSFKTKLCGYAIFKEDKLIKFLTNGHSRGINWIKNRIKSGYIILKAPDNKNVSMEIVASKTTIKPYIQEDSLQCDIKVMFSTNIAETMSKENIFNNKELESLEKQQEDKVKQEVQDILQHAQELNMDFFGIISNFMIKYPSMKKELQDSWSELFPEIHFNVEVDSNINRTYLLREPTGSK